MSQDLRPKRVVIAGASGLIGGALKSRLIRGGIEVTELSLRPRPGDAPGATPPSEMFEGASAVVNLAGAPIARRWTERVKREIVESRVNITRALVAAMAAIPEGRRPEVFVSMSGVGIYGLRRPELRLDERAEIAPPGVSFLSDVAREWEAAAMSAEQAGIRTVVLRTGMVLSRRGGALPRIVFPYRFFLGGPLGEGSEHTPWISLEDLTSLIFFALRRKNISGPVNAVAPHAVTSRDFAQALGVALRRPAALRVPPAVLRLIGGRMAGELLLADIAPFPAKAMEAGFEFRHNGISDTFSALFGPRVAPF